MNHQGVVEAISSKTVNTRRGPANVYGVKIAGEWVDFAFNPPRVEKGEFVSVEVEKNQYNKLVVVKGSKVVKEEAQAPSSESEYKFGPNPEGKVMKRADFPVPVGDKGIAICRQNALTNAINYLSWAHKTPTVDEVIGTAAQFAKWTTGHAEVEVASELLREMYPDMTELAGEAGDE